MKKGRRKSGPLVLMPCQDLLVLLLALLVGHGAGGLAGALAGGLALTAAAVYGAAFQARGLYRLDMLHLRLSPLYHGRRVPPFTNIGGAPGRMTRAAYGADGRGRTGTLSPAADFESATSANSITSAYHDPVIISDYADDCKFFLVYAGGRGGGERKVWTEGRDGERSSTLPPRRRGEAARHMSPGGMRGCCPARQTRREFMPLHAPCAAVLKAQLMHGTDCACAARRGRRDRKFMPRRTVALTAHDAPLLSAPACPYFSTT